MSNADGSLHIVFNGEIYNHLEERPGLEANGHIYRTRCDTEAILHLYEQEGRRAVQRLQGMFAFAIWDRSKRELFLARDRLGVKPLYYVHADDGALYFASEIKSLLAAGAVEPELNFAALPDYLANHATSGDETLFRRVKRLLPGHTLVWKDGGIWIESYWDVAVQPKLETSARGDADYIDEWTALFRRSVKLRLMADVPLGMFLSGGIDSSAIAAVMSQMVDEPIKTFSVAFPEHEANELAFARLAAKAFRTDHHEVIVTPGEFFRELARLIWHEDEPLAHPSSVALHMVSRLAADHVKVVLTGEGSDELLGGYERYRKTIYNLQLGRAYSMLAPTVVRQTVRSLIKRLPAGATVRHKAERTFLYLEPLIETLYLDNFAVFGSSLQRTLLTSETRERVGGGTPYGVAHQYLRGTDARTLLDALLYLDLKTYLHELLMKQDQMSMAASIESRVPFLDHKLVEFSARLPERMKIRGWTTKYVLRQSMRGVLPEAILRRPKMGFPVPVGAWFRGPFAWVLDEYLLSARARERGLFDPAVVQRLVREHETGLRNHTERLWSLVNLEVWLRVFLDGDDSPVRAGLTTSKVC